MNSDGNVHPVMPRNVLDRSPECTVTAQVRGSLVEIASVLQSLLVYADSGGSGSADTWTRRDLADKPQFGSILAKNVAAAI